MVNETETMRRLLCGLGDAIRDSVMNARTAGARDDLADVAGSTAADTIYRIDKISEAAIVAWFRHSWPKEQPVEVVMEGLEDGVPLVFPESVRVEQTRWKCILDPIDGTRAIMYDKRAAWALAAVAPQRGTETNLQDLVVAAMTELPTSKQGRADQFSAVRGAGREGLCAETIDLANGARRAINVRPSQAESFAHGFASLVKFFPEGKALTARVEERVWARLVGLGATASPEVFDDQYLSTGGQVYELLVGHDRMIGDIRPLVLPRLGCGNSLCCHPYDICAALILEEAGGLVESPDGRPLSAPLDTTTPVAWVGYANVKLARLMRPALQETLRELDLL